MPLTHFTLATLKFAIADALAAVEGLKVYGYMPRDFDELPACAISTLRVLRREPDAGESQLGSVDLGVRFSIELRVDNSDPETAEMEADALLGQVIGAFDGNQTLGNTPGVIDAVIVTAELGETPADSPRPMLGYRCELGVLQLVD